MKNITISILAITLIVLGLFGFLFHKHKQRSFLDYRAAQDMRTMCLGMDYWYQHYVKPTSTNCTAGETACFSFPSVNATPTIKFYVAGTNDENDEIDTINCLDYQK